MALTDISTSTHKIVWSFRGLTNMQNEYEGRPNGFAPVESLVVVVPGFLTVMQNTRAVGLIIAPDVNNTVPIRIGATQPGGPGTPLVGGVSITPNWSNLLSLDPYDPVTVGFKFITIAADPAGHAPTAADAFGTRLVWI